MRKTIVFLIVTSLISACSVRLVPVEPLITKESNGIIIKAGKQSITFFKDDLYTPVYIKIINNTDKKIKLDYSNFVLVDDHNNQFSSVSLDKIVKKYQEKNKKNTSDRYICPPYCNPRQMPYYGGYNTSYPYGSYVAGYGTPYYQPFYPYFSTDPYLYYKDKDGNFQTIPPTFNPSFYASPPTEIPEENPELMGLRMEELYPHFQMGGYLYFHQATKLAKGKIKLLVFLPGIEQGSEPLELEFFVK